MKRHIKIAVRELVEFVMRSGDLELEYVAPTRSIDGIRAHQTIQRSRPAHYLSEVSVSHQVEKDNFILDIGGRIDGIYPSEENQPDGRVVIDEIKSTRRNLDELRTGEQPIHRSQAKCYAYIFAVQNHLQEIDTQLTYYQIDSGEILEIRQPHTFPALEKDFDTLISDYLKWATNIAAWVEIRDTSIETLDFPFSVYRPGQRQMAVEVYRAIRNQDHMIIQAATGIGKTMAVIFPAVKAMVERLNEKVFYLTARTTGRMIAEKAIDELRDKGLKLKSLTLTAKDKICFNPENRCTPEECEFACGYYDRVHDALHTLFSLDGFSREKIVTIAGDHRICPFEFSLDLSLWMDCIICDYNYAFDPRVYLRRFFAENGGKYTFLIDESHNLVDRSRDMFSAEISKQAFLDVRRLIRTDLPGIYKRLGKINTWMVKARKRCESADGTLSEEIAPTDLIPLLSAFIRDTEYWLSRNLKTHYRESLLELYFTVTGFIRVAEQYDRCYMTCYEKIGKDVRLKLFCMDPSNQMGTALKRCQTAVFFSATMTPGVYFKKILGCNLSTETPVIPSPFPPRNLRLFIADRLSTFYRHREQTKDQVTGIIETLVLGKKGNYLLYFPSYAYMHLIYTAFIERQTGVESIVQKPGMSESDRMAFLDCFSLEQPQTLVGFAVMGGIFGEGIDLVGDRLSGVGIVGVGLPSISLENDLIRNYFNQSQNEGFEYAYLYPGINRVLQAAGRVIRTSRDRGVVLLIDQRFSTYRYRSLFPATWQPVKIMDENQLEKELKAFWDS